MATIPEMHLLSSVQVGEVPHFATVNAPGPTIFQHALNRMTVTKISTPSPSFVFGIAH